MIDVLCLSQAAGSGGTKNRCIPGSIISKKTRCDFMKRLHNLIFPVIAVVLLICAAAVQPQLSMDEQSAIVVAVVQTMNPDNMKATIVAEVSAEMIDRFTAAGYVGLAAALSVPLQENEESEVPVIHAPSTPTPTPEKPVTEETAAPKAENAGPRLIETNIADYYDGAVLQEDGTYRGLHAKQVNAYAYTIGEDENGVVRQFHTEYTPNTRFNVDVVFENDGSLVWPPRIEMRHVGNVGEYTGHAESVISDRTYDPVKPGDRCSFTVSAYGSEVLGWTTFYFQLYDADSGSIIEGGQGSFTYHAI